MRCRQDGNHHQQASKHTSDMGEYRSHKRKIPKERRVAGWRVSVTGAPRCRVEATYSRMPAAADHTSQSA